LNCKQKNTKKSISPSEYERHAFLLGYTFRIYAANNALLSFIVKNTKIYPSSAFSEHHTAINDFTEELGLGISIPNFMEKKYLIDFELTNKLVRDLENQLGLKIKSVHSPEIHNTFRLGLCLGNIFEITIFERAVPGGLPKKRRKEIKSFINDAINIGKKLNLDKMLFNDLRLFAKNVEKINSRIMSNEFEKAMAPLIEHYSEPQQ
jgi:hypothetical protein